MEGTWSRPRKRDGHEAVAVFAVAEVVNGLSVELAVWALAPVPTPPNRG